jgi:hypothetical protein
MTRSIVKEVSLLRPSVTAAEESVLLMLALARSRPCGRILLARAFALLYQPTLLKQLVPNHLKAQAASWARAVKGRTRAPGLFRAALDQLLALGALADDGPTSAIRVIGNSYELNPQPWWFVEAELGLATADVMTNEVLERLASKLPSSERHELRVSA